LAKHWEDHKDELGELARRDDFGLVCDMDGTLAPIVERPEEAAITPHNRELLTALVQELALVAVVSGRGAAALQDFVGIPGVVYAGNHGLERWIDGEVRPAPGVAEHRPHLQQAADVLAELTEEGTELEDKGATLTLHYRRHADPEGYAQRLAPTFAEIADRYGLMLGGGRRVFEFRPPLAVDKGTALRDLIGEYRLGAALFIGDDVTDIAALKMARNLRQAGESAAWGAAVQSAGAPAEVAAAADFLVSEVSGVEDLLAWLLSARKASST
jgi:trehalose 6-phosphate phosphatase